MKILDGRIVQEKIAEKLRGEIKKLKIRPTLAIIQLGDLAESNSYIRQKKLFAERIGADVNHIRLSTTNSEKEIINRIKKLNKDKKTYGIIVQLPLPIKLNKEKIIETINPLKDVDGLVSKKYTPATARGVMELLKEYKIPIKDKNVLVIGRSELVGKPIAKVLADEGGAVGVAHRATKNIKELSKAAAILVAAAGHPKLITKDWVSPGQTIVDVGITIVNGKLIGDVDFEEVSKIVNAISPVPGGVGPMTVAALFENLIDAQNEQN
jgi:methylenetetrahydrofolate dehydrogenase (NADP+)/methenyltetrahydrofolate cyclohydrolase